MFDGRDSYETFDYVWEPDAFFADEEDMRQHLVGVWWHRPLHGTINKIACDDAVTFHTQFTPQRSFSLIGPLCPNCHTIPELAKSAELARLEREAVESFGDDKKGKK